MRMRTETFEHDVTVLDIVDESDKTTEAADVILFILRKFPDNSRTAGKSNDLVLLKISSFGLSSLSMILVGKHTFFGFFMNCKGEKPKRRRIRKKSNSSSKVLNCIVYSLMNGLHSNMLYWKRKNEGIFQVKFLHKNNPKWNENMLSLFKATEEAISKERFKNYSMSSKHAENCKIRFRANLNKLISTGALVKVPLKEKDKSKKTYKIVNFAGVANAFFPSTSSGEDESIASTSAPIGHEQFISGLLKDQAEENQICENLIEMNINNTRTENMEVEPQVPPLRSADTLRNDYAFCQKNVSFTVNSSGMPKLGKAETPFREYSVAKPMNVQYQITNSSSSAQAVESPNEFSSPAQAVESVNEFYSSSAQASNNYGFLQENVNFLVNSSEMPKLSEAETPFREYSVAKPMNVQYQITNSSSAAQAVESPNEFSSPAQAVESVSEFFSSSAQAELSAYGYSVPPVQENKLAVQAVKSASVFSSSSALAEFSAILSNLPNEVGNQLISDKVAISILGQVLDILRERNATEGCPGGLTCQSKEQLKDIGNCTFVDADSIQMKTLSELAEEPTLSELNMFVRTVSVPNSDFSAIPQTNIVQNSSAHNSAVMQSSPFCYGMYFPGFQVNDPLEFNIMENSRLHSPRENILTELQNVVPIFDDCNSLTMNESEESYYSQTWDDNRKVKDLPTCLWRSENPLLSSTADIYNEKADEYTDMEGQKFFGFQEDCRLC